MTDSPPEQPTAADAIRAQLEQALGRLEMQRKLLTNKETLAENQRKITELQWRLGLISDEDFAAQESFHASFRYEADL